MKDGAITTSTKQVALPRKTGTNRVTTLTPHLRKTMKNLIHFEKREKAWNSAWEK